MSDILKISDAQARVLRSIAHYEEESSKKGGTQYTSSQKVSNKIHVSGSTFNDNIKKLDKNLMVIGIKGERKTKPYTITEIGQIAWLRCFPIKENKEMFQKIFPNISVNEFEEVFFEIVSVEKRIKPDMLIDAILKNTLDNFHIEQTKGNTPFSKLILEETIELSSYNDLVKTSYKRYYNMIHPSFDKSNYKKLNKLMKGFCEDYDKLKIKLVDRITFLFYYTLIQAISNEAYMFKIINKYILPELVFDDDQKYQKAQYKCIQLSAELIKKKKKIIRIITTNNSIKNIIETNLKQLSEYENTDFQEINNLFFK